MSPGVIFVAILGLAVVMGLIGVFVVRPMFLGDTHAAFDKTCAAVGFEPLAGPSELYVACGGEVRGRRIVLMWIQNRAQLGPRIDVLAEAGLSFPVESGGALLRPGRAPDLLGPPEVRTAVTAALTPEVTAAVDSRLGGRFAFSSWDVQPATSAMRALVKARWPDDWHGLLVQTWVPLDADPATLKAAMNGLVDVRDVFARAPGVTEAAP
jgi:hypothetical protein